MNTYQKVLKKLNTKFAQTFKYDVENNSTYYIFAANPTPQSVLSYPSDSIMSDVDTYSSMLFGNKIQDTDVSLITKNYAWVANTVYSKYDPEDNELYSKAFYVTVFEGSDYHVYKCLDNNLGAASTDQPLGTDSTLIYSMTDGYVWKYLYTVSDFMYRKFGSDDYIPVDTTQNGQVSNNLGAIQVISLKDSGLGYNNYTLGSFPETASINYNNSAVQYALDINASSKNSFYIGCLMKVTSVNNSQSEYRTIIDYNVTGLNRIVVIDTPFTLNLKAGDLYEIYPKIKIQDLSVTSTETCIARAIISANTGNSVSQIEVLNPGSGYRNVAAYVAADNSVGVISNSSINPIISPMYGHGSNLAEELFANKVCVSTTFNGNTGVLLSDNGYGTIGIIKDPAYANVAVSLNSDTLIGAFNVGEMVYRYRSYKLNGNVSIQSNTKIITSDDSDFGSSIRKNDQVIITNGYQNLFANITSIIDSNTMMLDQLPSFTEANCKISIAQLSPFGLVSAYDYNTVLNLTNVVPNNFDASTSSLVGTDSNCTATINSVSSSYITVNGRPAFNFSQFNQLTGLVGTINSNFESNELLVQGNNSSISTPSAVLFAANNVAGINSDILYVTNIKNTFQPGTITGDASGASFTYQYKYDGELIKDSGDIVYLENVNYISRSPNQAETIKIILEF